MAVNCVDTTIEDEELVQLGAMGLATRVNLSAEQVRACFLGPLLSRAIAISGLRDVQLVRLFPGSRWKHARNLQRIGSQLRGERVRRELQFAPFRVLWAAARWDSEEEQIAAAVAYRLGR